jgi:tripartite-type tricarboxylate transporter receptor subunit TctC
MRNGILSQALSIAAMAGIGFGAAAQADEVADFYKDKTITLLMSTGVGGSNDLNARTLLQHMVKHIPGNPDYKPINMPGAGHVRASNFIYNKAPKDGTYIGAFVRFYVLHQAMGGKGVKYDATKFGYLGSTSSSNVVLGTWHTTGIKKFDELKSKELIVGGTGVGSGTVIFPTLFNNVLGAKMKIVQGYKSGHMIDLAMERGEVFGRAGFTFESIESVHPDWLKENKFNILTQVGLRKEPGYEHIPMATDLATDKDDKSVINIFAGVVAVGSPIFTNQGVPKARLAALRTAFNTTLKDPAYLAAMKKVRLSVKPTSGEELTEIVEGIINAPPAVIAKARSVMSKKQLVPCKTFTSAKYCRAARKKKG